MLLCKRKKGIYDITTLSVLWFILSLIFAYLTKKLIITKFETVLQK